MYLRTEQRGFVVVRVLLFGFFFLTHRSYQIFASVAILDETFVSLVSMKYLLGTVLIFIHPRIEIIKQFINCEARWVVMLSCCLDLDVLDALSYDRYANHNHSL